MQRGMGQDFYHIRPYQISESARHVDWKATAHTGALQVREFARDEDQALVIYLDLDVPGDAAPWFESAVECAAFLSHRLTRHGRAVRLRTQQANLIAQSEDDVYPLLRYLGLVQPRTGGGAEAPDDDHSYQIVFSANPDAMTAAGWELDGPHGKILSPAAHGRFGVDAL
jgi:hypothetical protein